MVRSAAAAQSSRFSMVSHGVSRSLRLIDREGRGSAAHPAPLRRCKPPSDPAPPEFQAPAPRPAAHRPAPPCRRYRCHRSRPWRPSCRCAPAPAPAGSARLPCHGGGVKLLAGVAVPHQIHIYRVAYDGVTCPQGGICPNGHVLIAAWPDTYYNYLTQNAPPNAPPRRRRSHRPALFFVRSVFRHPAAPPAHRHCPRR